MHDASGMQRHESNDAVGVSSLVFGTVFRGFRPKHQLFVHLSQLSSFKGNNRVFHLAMPFRITVCRRISISRERYTHERSIYRLSVFGLIGQSIGQPEVVIAFFQHDRRGGNHFEFVGRYHCFGHLSRCRKLVCSVRTVECGRRYLPMSAVGLKNKLLGNECRLGVKGFDVERKDRFVSVACCYCARCQLLYIDGRDGHGLRNKLSNDGFKAFGGKRSGASEHHSKGPILC